MAKLDLINKKFGRLTVIEKAQEKPVKWRCKCDCGNIKILPTRYLTSGDTQSCGCLKKQLISDYNTNTKTTHGLSESRIYRTWINMRDRCYNPKYKQFDNYGGRGITVCDDWNNNFENFNKWALENGYKDNLTIDRIDNDKGYCPENCRWITIQEQSHNKRTNRNITINGITKTASQWSKISGIGVHTILNRINLGWETNDLLNPVRGGGNK
jgi:hypothetical protein